MTKIINLNGYRVILFAFVAILITFGFSETEPQPKAETTPVVKKKKGKKKEIELGFTQINLNFYGIYSQSLGSYEHEVLTTNTINLISQDPEFKIKSWIRILDSLKYIYSRFDTIKTEDIFSYLPAGSHKNGLLVTLEKIDEDFNCHLFIVSGEKEPIRKIKTFHLHSNVSQRIRKVSNLIHKAIRYYYSLESEPGSTPSLIELGQPLRNALLVKNDFILEKDSVSNIILGSTLMLNKAKGLQFLQGEKFLIILHPNSSYTFVDNSEIQLNKGKIGLMLLGQEMEIKLEGMNFRGRNLILTADQNDISSVEIMTGKIAVNLNLDSSANDSVGYPYRISSRGYHFQKEKLNEKKLSLAFKPFIPFLTDEVIAYFKSTDKDLFKKPVYIIDFFHQDATDPMDYFIAESFSDIGISMDAIIFEGEAWNAKSNLIKKGIHENSCFLCKPDGLSID